MIADTHARFDFGALARDYDRWYETARGMAHDNQQKALVRRILPHPTGHAALLDVGCGTGHWSRFYASLGFNVTGVDVSRPMLQQACTHDGGDCSFARADGYCLPFADATFDVVSAMAAVEFATCAETIVAEMFRCVREGGAVIVGTLNRLAPLNRNRVEDGKEPYLSARMFSPAELRGLLAPYGTVHVPVTKSGTGHGRTDAFILAIARGQCGNDAAYRPGVAG
ncbi:MAG: class I SAM-dependent methyltransferase [bacterium]|nr:class I SAM-dependent methyltransferase [bacterium]